MARTYQTDLEDARRRLAEGLARVREQSDHIERLYRDRRPIQEAVELLSAMRRTVTQMETHVRFLAETEKKQE